jgi:YihY family inner membrane protein
LPAALLGSAGVTTAWGGAVSTVNPIEGAIRRIDAAQRSHKAPALVFGIVKKYGDDNGGVLAASLAHAGFVSLFPLLLVLVTILGLVASGDPALRHQALDAVANQVPLIGHQLSGNVHELRRSSVIGLAVGLVALTWGATGLAQAGLFTMAQVWNLPGPERPGYVQRLGRAGLFLGVLGLGVIVTTLLASLGSYGHNAVVIVVLGQALAVAANIGMYFIGFRVLTPSGIPARKLVPGAVAGGAAWTVLQVLGTYLVHHLLHSDSVYGVFATVLGLLAWIYLAVEITVYAAEINVVLARRLWPRSIVQPPLTEADRAVLAAQALQNQRRDDQHVEVSFDDPAAGVTASGTTPRTADEITPVVSSAPEDPGRRQGSMVKEIR